MLFLYFISHIFKSKNSIKDLSQNHFYITTTYDGSLVDILVVVEQVSTDLVSSFIGESSIMSDPLLQSCLSLSQPSIKSFLRSLLGGLTPFIRSSGDLITVPVYFWNDLLNFWADEVLWKWFSSKDKACASSSVSSNERKVENTVSL